MDVSNCNNVHLTQQVAAVYLTYIMGRYFRVDLKLLTLKKCILETNVDTYSPV